MSVDIKDLIAKRSGQIVITLGPGAKPKSWKSKHAEGCRKTKYSKNQNRFLLECVLTLNSFRQESTI